MIERFEELTAHSGAAPFQPIQFELRQDCTAIVHIDMQNDFLHEDGAYALNQINIDHMRRVIQPTRKLIEAARARSIPQIWTRHGTRSAVDAGAFHKLRPQLSESGLRQNTWGYEILDDLGPEDEDWFVEKTRLSAFFQTNLEVILRGLGAETVIFTGVLTNQCVAATTKDAMFRDFRPIVIEDCAGTTLPNLHDPALAMMKVGWAEVTSLEDILNRIDDLA
jgi:ureidoacrylate peracid hydrolase